MSKARMEILKLVAEGRISPEEGDRLHAALDDTDVPESENETATKSWTDGLAVSLRDFADSVRRTVDDAICSAQKVFDEHRPETESVEIAGGVFRVDPEARLKIQHAIRVSFGGSSKGSDIIIRTGLENQVRIVRGQAVEVHRNGSDYVLTWAKGNLEVEVPERLRGLDVRCLGGDLEVQSFPGPMSLETMGGEMRVRSPRSPLHCRTLGGKARIADMILTEGTTSIHSTGGDVQIDLSSSASLTIRATTLGGRIEFPEGTERDAQGRTRRRAVCVVGEGSGTLTIDTLGGNVRVRQSES